MTAIILRFTKKFIKRCSWCKKPFVQQDAAGDPSYSQYGCGVYGQPHLAKGVKRSTGQHSDG